MKELSNHPCFNEKVRHSKARVHLPIAINCNIQCNYCNRKYDCCNETRPGVSSTTLLPEQSVEYFRHLIKELPNISVVGIAGPGDPFASPAETLKTIELIKSEFPDMLFCISSNGLNLAPYIDILEGLGVTHITITINSLNPVTASKIYKWIRYNKRVYRGEEAGRILINNQLQCLKILKNRSIKVKVNTVICSGINENEVEEISKRVALEGVEIMNCIPMYPVRDTEFQYLSEPTKETMDEVNKKISKNIKSMQHCSRCRADAAGLIGSKDTNHIDLLRKYSTHIYSTNSAERVAVATREGLLVNLHLGEAKKMYIFENSDDGYRFVETRNTPNVEQGTERWETLIDRILFDCKAILVLDIGEKPAKAIQDKGIKIIKMRGLIEGGLDHIYKGTEIRVQCYDNNSSCRTCYGGGTGCG